ncbi:MAG: hypothetical protein J1E43_02615 [Christensenellaceae bacterium]|nr:hypothetical protein [Christensenellaceae bacterium]
MKFVKCPRCELNYITESERYCKVCLREMKGDGAQDEVELCSVCNEAPALPGRDVCLFCLKEMNGQNNNDDQADTESAVNPNAIRSMDDVSSMDEIPEIDSDMPAGEYSEMENELSLESMQEDEADEDSEDEEDI